SPLAAGSYVLEVGDGPLDLAAVAAEPSGPFAFTVGPGADHPTIFEAEPPGRVAASTVGNHFGFHGLAHDPETGLIYARHRMLDPELGRFITKDPLGYVDGPSAYAFAMNSPANYKDPLGLEAAWFGRQQKARHGERGIDLDAAIAAELQRRHQEEVAIEAKLLGSHLNATGFDWASAPSVLKNEAFRYFNRSKTVRDAAAWSGVVAGDTACDQSSVFCAVDWQTLGAGARTMELGVLAGVAVFDPFAVPGGLARGGIHVAAYRAGLADDLLVAREMGALSRIQAANQAADIHFAVGYRSSIEPRATFYIHPGPGAAHRGEIFQGAWIARDLHKQLRQLVGKADARKFTAALKKGVVGPKAESGIKILNKPVLGYTHELKIGRSAQRLLGRVDENGVMIFERFVRGGLHK
ncbi:MAG: RHS repeat-associated core domain-containing protein, partial [Acidobacteriota bacterium]